MLRALLPLIETKADQSFLEKAQKRMESWNELMEERGTRTDMPMKPQVVTYKLNKLLEQRRHCFLRQRHDRNVVGALYRDARHDAVLSFRLARDHGQRAAVQHRRGRRVSRTGRWSASSATADSRC